MPPSTLSGLAVSDWAVVAAYLAGSVALAFAFRKRASKGLDEFFLSGRRLPWWLAGTSMVATTFAADTPLAVTELVARHGIAGNWLWWSQAFGGALTAVLFAGLWRRAGVMTDAEFSELRYSGPAAAALRGFRAVYLAVPINLIVMGWVHLAMAKVLAVCFGVERMTAVWACFLLTVAYSTAAGLWGVVVTDFFQFLFAMGGCVALAIAAVSRLGGLEALASKAAAASPMGGEVLRIFPVPGSAWMPAEAFLTYLGVAWWASWYPGAEPGGGGYVAQRLAACEDDRHATGAALWFTFAHYVLRPWPWIVVGLASIAMFPGLADPGTGFPRVMMAVLPSPLKGLLIAAFLAAYMSTISTHLNWGASYLVSDVYRRFLRPGATDRDCVRTARLASLALAALSVLVTGWMDSVAGAWMFLIAIGAGCGSVYILRWLWWRVNAWSEIAAMAGAAAVSLGLQTFGGLKASDPGQWAELLVLTTAATTALWLAATWLTPPEPEAVLRRFYRRVSPPPLGWGPVADEPCEHPPLRLGASAAAWAAGCACVYGGLLAGGELLLGSGRLALVYAAAASASAAFVWLLIGRRT